MAAGVASGVVALMVQQHEDAFKYRRVRPLSANLVKAMLQFSALPLARADRLTQGTGQINAAGALALAGAVDTSVRPTQWWLRSGVSPYSDIGGKTYSWSQNVIWGDEVLGGNVVYVSSAAFNDNIVWGTGDDNIVWGTAAPVLAETSSGAPLMCGRHNLVWKDRIIGQWPRRQHHLGDGQRRDNIIWGTLKATNIVWGTCDGDNIVWGTWNGDNIVWGTSRRQHRLGHVG